MLISDKRITESIGEALDRLLQRFVPHFLQQTEILIAKYGCLVK